MSPLDAITKFLLMTDVKNISLKLQPAECGSSGKKRVSSLSVLQLQRQNNDNDIIITKIIRLLSIIIMIIIIINTRQNTGKLT